MNKQYRIVSAPRFIAFLSICALLIIYITVSVTGMCRVEGLTEQSYDTVKVSAGDTLWDIAREYGDPKTDVRETIDTICELNNITADELQDGDIILIPERL